jgi:uncharacterized phiE125 gp8 family phage protein
MACPLIVQPKWTISTGLFNIVEQSRNGAETMALTLITPPTSLPVTVEELKAWSRVDHDDDDVTLAALGDAATTFVETALGRQLVTATWELTLRWFPCDLIRLPRPPLQSVAHVKYRDKDGALVTMPSADYLVDITADPGTIEPARSWPAGTGYYPDSVQVRYVAGYGDQADVPPNIKLAIMGMAAHWYEVREGASGVPMQETPLHVGRLIDQARLWHVS